MSGRLVGSGSRLVTPRIEKFEGEGVRQDLSFWMAFALMGAFVAAGGVAAIVAHGSIERMLMLFTGIAMVVTPIIWLLINIANSLWLIKQKMFLGGNEASEHENPSE